MISELWNALNQLARFPGQAAQHLRNARGLMQSGLTQAGQAARHNVGLPVPQQLQTFNLNALRQQLGTPVPTQQQIQAAQQQVIQYNQQQAHAAAQKPFQAAGQLIAATSKVGAFAVAVVGAVKALNEFSTFLERHALEGLRRFNAEIGAQAIRREVFDMRMGIQYGRDVSGSTVRLSEANMAREKALEPYSAAVTNTTNMILTGFDNLETGILGWFEEIGLRSAIESYNSSFGDEQEHRLDPLMHIIRGMQGLSTKPAPLTTRPLSPEEERAQNPYQSFSQRSSLG